MIRPNRIVCSALAIILMAILSSWVVSFWHPHFIRLGIGAHRGILFANGTIQFRSERQTELRADHGKVIVVEVPVGDFQMSDHHWVHITSSTIYSGIRISLSPWRAQQLAAFGFGGYYTDPQGNQLDLGYFVHIFALSYWVIAAPLLILLVWRLYIEWKTRPRGPGFCLSCGYDLRATPQRCPECGATA